MGKRGGGPSLREKAITQSVHAHKLRVQRALKPPYPCPKCFRENTLRVTPVVDWQTKKPKPHHFRCHCPHCGFEMDDVEAHEPIDAYCKLTDLVRSITG